MAEITNKMTEIAYLYVKKFYSGEMTRQEAADEIHLHSGMAKGSASDYVVNFGYMMNGKCYKRTFNNYATKYILEKIKFDYGEIIFFKALDSVKQHIEYYESLRQGRLKGIRKIYEELSSDNKKEQKLYPDEIEENPELIEGAKKQVTVNIYERNQKARQACISKYGAKCSVCNFEFGKKYGHIGQGFIHIHHLIEIGQIGEAYKVVPEKDLCPVCPNCHAMLHQRKPIYTISELKEIIKENI